MLFAPLVGALLIPVFSRVGNEGAAKQIALWTSIVSFVISVVLYFQYTGAIGGEAANEEFAFYFTHSWLTYGGLNVNFTLALDGISVYLVLLSTLIFPLSIYFSWGSVTKSLTGYYSLLLVLEVGVIGFFLSLDMLLFYVFFEMVLIPMYFLIGMWGGKDRVYASLKFFLYTLVGSLLMLIGIIYVGLDAAEGIAGVSFTSDYDQIREFATLSLTEEYWLFAAFTLSFAVKVPLFPVHTWLPDAHTEAPTAGSVILAAVLLKMGTYGLIRFCLIFFPLASIDAAPIMAGLAVVGIIYGAMAAMVQTDVKKLVAYSSVSHLGFIVLGIFAFTEQGMSGAIMQMVGHGIATGGLFLLVGMIYDRRHTRAIKDFQGIATVMPKFALLFMITLMASVGLPGLNGFVGEFLVLMGSFKSAYIGKAFAVFAATGVVIAAVYLLWMFRRVMFGQVDKDENRQLIDLNFREVAVMVPLVVLMFWMGLYATPFLKQIGHSSDKVVETIQMKGEQPNRASREANPASIEVAFGIDERKESAY
jgi:NADH-quinone oxidoreductase subunit M